MSFGAATKSSHATHSFIPARLTYSFQPLALEQLSLFRNEWFWKYSLDALLHALLLKMSEATLSSILSIQPKINIVLINVCALAPRILVGISIRKPMFRISATTSGNRAPSLFRIYLLSPFPPSYRVTRSTQSFNSRSSHSFWDRQVSSELDDKNELVRFLKVSRGWNE